MVTDDRDKIPKFVDENLWVKNEMSAYVIGPPLNTVVVRYDSIVCVPVRVCVRPRLSRLSVMVFDC